LLNPNSKLHNLFGGLKQLDPTQTEKKEAADGGVRESREEKLLNFDKDYDFSDSEADQHEKSQIYSDDDRPFANMYSMNTNVDFAVNKAQKTATKPSTKKAKKVESPKQ
jgi:hypothetical protein